VVWAGLEDKRRLSKRKGREGENGSIGALLYKKVKFWRQWGGGTTRLGEQGTARAASKRSALGRGSLLPGQAKTLRLLEKKREK